MKKILPFFLLILICGFSSKATCPKLLYDGIYVFEIDAENAAVIRFYEDGMVLVSTSVRDYAKVMTWFNRDPENASRVLTGKYKISKGSCSIRFNVKGETGEQKYDGNLVSEKNIHLHIFNPADKSSTDREYHFVKP